MAGETPVVELGFDQAEELCDRCWSAVSKLESQAVRTHLPPVYRQIVLEAFEALRALSARSAMARSRETDGARRQPQDQETTVSQMTQQQGQEPPPVPPGAEPANEMTRRQYYAGQALVGLLAGLFD